MLTLCQNYMTMVYPACSWQYGSSFFFVCTANKHSLFQIKVSVTHILASEFEMWSLQNRERTTPLDPKTSYSIYIISIIIYSQSFKMLSPSQWWTSRIPAELEKVAGKRVVWATLKNITFLLYVSIIFTHTTGLTDPKQWESCNKT